MRATKFSKRRPFVGSVVIARSSRVAAGRLRATSTGGVVSVTVTVVCAATWSDGLTVTVSPTLSTRSPRRTVAKPESSACELVPAQGQQHQAKKATGLGSGVALEPGVQVASGHGGVGEGRPGGVGDDAFDLSRGRGRLCPGRGRPRQKGQRDAGHPGAPCRFGHFKPSTTYILASVRMYV